MNSKKKAQNAKTPSELSMAAFARVTELIEKSGIEPAYAMNILETVKMYGACKWTHGHECGMNTEQEIQEEANRLVAAIFPSPEVYPAQSLVEKTERSDIFNAIADATRPDSEIFNSLPPEQIHSANTALLGGGQDPNEFNVTEKRQ